MHKGIAFVVPVSREDVAFLTDPAQNLAARAGCLAELVEGKRAKAGVPLAQGWAVEASLAALEGLRYAPVGEERAEGAI